MAILAKTQMSGEWKELLLLLLGAFIGSYGKIIDYWFSDQDKDKMLVQKMDEEDGVTLSNTGNMKDQAPAPSNVAGIIASNVNSSPSNVVSTIAVPQVGVEIDEDGDGVMDGIDNDGDGVIDEYFEHRNCHHVWGDSDHDGHEECLVCGLLRENVEQI